MPSSEARASSPLVSVITNSYNARRFLRTNVDSMLAQTFEDWEQIVIDCGSTDGSVELLEELRHPRLRVLRVPFCGVARGRILGIAESRAELVAILDADDYAMPTRIADQVRLLREQPEVVGCGGGIVQVVEETGRERTFTYPAHHEGLVRLLRSAINAFSHTTLMFRRSAYDRVGGYSDLFEKSEDFDFLLRLANVGRLASIPRPVARYTVHGDSHFFRHKPQGRDAKYYLMLAVLLHALDDRPGATPPSVDAATAYLDMVGSEGIEALCARWALPGLPAAALDRDWASLRYFVSAQLHWGTAMLRRRGAPWWAYSGTPARVAETLARSGATNPSTSTPPSRALCGSPHAD